MKEKIWHEFIDARYGDLYLCQYIARQRSIRKWFKIGTILFSASGIFFVYKDYEIPTYISLAFIGFAQLATMVESHLIHSEKQIEDLSQLRMLYYDRWNKLEKLFIRYDDYTEQEATDKFFEYRELAKEAEKLDDQLNIQQYSKLMEIAEVENRQYLKTYYNV